MLDALLLLPPPRHLEIVDGTLSLKSGGLIVINDPALFPIATRLQNRMPDKEQWSISASPASISPDDVAITMNLVPGSVRHQQGYRLSCRDQRITITAQTPQGVFYGVQTLIQITRQTADTIPYFYSEDWPDFPQRGVMLDISRDKVPNMQTLFELIDKLVEWKINQIQLYTEHTFAYRQHPTVWQHAAPLTGEEILTLDAYCQDRFIELVPNQNTFGHMERWLIHDDYRHLAECPDGCDTVWGHFDNPFTLYPGDPASFDLVRGLFDELLPHFTSRTVNVGCDETIDLGQGRSKERAEEVGSGRIYLDFVLKIYRDIKARGYTMQMWGDVIMHHPELAAELPRDLIALEWGYEADHPFEEHGQIFAASGVPFYVCPGTSSWNSIAGRTTNALENLRNAARNGKRNGAVGYLITDWGDNGHWQPLPVSYTGLAYGAALAWCEEQAVQIDVPQMLNHHVFQDQASLMGDVVLDLGNIYDMTGINNANGSILFRAMQHPSAVIANWPTVEPTQVQELAAYAIGWPKDDQEIVERMQAVNDRIDDIVSRLNQVEMERPDQALIKQEMTWVARMLRHAAQRIMWIKGSLSEGDKNSLQLDLAAECDYLIQDFESIWHSRCRPGGFTDSVKRLETLRESYQS